MDAPATLVWVAPSPPDAEQSRTLSSWAAARGLVLVEPQEARPPALVFDDAVGEQVEGSLDDAREGIAAHDSAAVDRALASAEARLRAHPELPSAAWLMAEVERARAARWRRIPPSDPVAAGRAWSRADALDGGRVAGVGEQPLVGAMPPSPPSVEPESPDRATLATLSIAVPAGERAWLDGAPVHATSVVTRAGLHALAVTWDGSPVWARWVDAPAGPSVVRVDAPEPPPCSTAELRDVHEVERDPSADQPTGSVAADRVRCPRWVAAAAGSRGGAVRVAACREDRCDPLLAWAPPAPWTRPVPAVERGSRWPSWATWGLVGTGAAVATALAIVAVSAGGSAPVETHFVYRGVKMP